MERITRDQCAVGMFFVASGLTLSGSWLALSAVPDVGHLEALASVAGHACFLALSTSLLWCICYHTSWYERHRTFVVLTFFSAMWMVMFASNLHNLLLAMRVGSPLLGAAVMSFTTSFGLALHVALPLSPESPNIDMWPAALAVIAHVSTSAHATFAHRLSNL